MRKKRRKDGGAVVQISPSAASVLYDGESLDDWDDEELVRGKRRGKDGKFRGRPPAVLPIQFVQELNRRRFTRAHAILADSLEDAARMLRAIIADPDAPYADRLKAIEILFDRILGRPTERLQLGIDDEPRWKRAVATAIVGTLEDAQALGSGSDTDVIDLEPEEDVLVDPVTGQVEEQITWHSFDSRTPQRGSP
jgi:hypothetical protein